MKIGIVLVGHGKLATELTQNIEFILKEKCPFQVVDIEDSNDILKSLQKIQEAVEKSNKGNGVLILSDLYGATPANLCLPLLKKGEVLMISGYNLPMLLKLSQMKEEQEIEKLVSFLIEYGQKHIHFK